MASVIKSIQKGSITIGAAASSNTATISAVTTANTVLIYDGAQCGQTNQTSGLDAAVRISLTNSTTVTATRGGTSSSVTVNFTVVEFASGVNSVQAGTIAIVGAATSNTATISAVGANAFVMWLGSSTATANVDTGDLQGSVTLTNTTTVTARCEANVALTIGYMVADLDSTIVNTVQARAVVHADTSSTKTDTITSVTPGNTLLFYNGLDDIGGHAAANGAYTLALTNGTTVTLAKNGTANSGDTIRYTVVQFASACLNGGLQRGTIALSAASSGTATISSIDPSLSFVNWGNWLGANANFNVTTPTLTLTNPTTVTAALNSAGTVTVAYEVIQFASGAAAAKPSNIVRQAVNRSYTY